jgi:hypothetical protein
MTMETQSVSSEDAMGAGLAAVLISTVTLNLLVTYKLVAPANVGELMDEALLQLEHSCGLSGSLGVAAQIARAHMLNVYRDIETLPPMATLREKRKSSE